MTERPLDMPDWAQVGEKRRAHIARVTALLDHWSVKLRLDATEAQAWHDVGRFHDALRDEVRIAAGRDPRIAEEGQDRGDQKERSDRDRHPEPSGARGGTRTAHGEPSADAASP